ncbi:MAG: hypothetical protein ACRCYY_14390 [Trueperaceae bacterium]
MEILVFVLWAFASLILAMSYSTTLLSNLRYLEGVQKVRILEGIKQVLESKALTLSEKLEKLVGDTRVNKSDEIARLKDLLAEVGQDNLNLTRNFQALAGQLEDKTKSSDFYKDQNAYFREMVEIKDSEIADLREQLKQRDT